MARQVRFTQLVKAAGAPHAATLWVADPAKDPEFKKAIEQNRIVTVHHVNVGTKKESGEVGFKKGGAASYLIFPKALPMAEGTRIIGLKFDMLEQPKVKDAVKIKPAKRQPKIERANIVEFPEPESKPAETESEPKKPKREKAKAKTELRKFTVTVEFAAKATKQIKVEANSASAAIEAALKEAKKRAPKAEWKLDATNVASHS